jgi:hypothetical protein
VFGGRWYKNTASVSKTLTAVTINNKRRDRFVIRWDPVTLRSGVVTVIDGVETVGTPASPAIDSATDVLLGYIESYNNGGVYEYSAVDERVYAFDNWVTLAMMQDDSVDTDELVDASVTTPKIVDLAVTTGKINDGAVTTVKIADEDVTTAKIEDGAVTATKLATNSVTEAKIGSGAVTADKIGSGAVTEAKIGSGAVTADKIGSGAVTEAKIGSSAVTGDKIAAGAVDSVDLSSRLLYLTASAGVQNIASMEIGETRICITTADAVQFKTPVAGSNFSVLAMDTGSNWMNDSTIAADTQIQTGGSFLLRIVIITRTS